MKYNKLIIEVLDKFIDHIRENCDICDLCMLEMLDLLEDMRSKT